MLKICVVAPELVPVPPSWWGGSESVTHDLCTALAEMGHEVTLIARPGSQKPLNGHLIETFKDGNDPPEAPKNWGVIERHHHYYKDFVKKFDGVVHDHSNGKLAWRIHPNVINTVHWCQHPASMGYSRMVAVSYAQAKWLNQHCPSLRRIPVVHHGIDLKRFMFREEKQGYYLFFSVMAEYKGARHALQLAKETEELFVFAGRNGDMTETIKNCNLPNVLFMGEVSDSERARLFADAKAFVFPTGAWGDADPPNWLEVFGLVMREALASGTPCIVSDNGACAEVIEDGRVGFVCNSYEELKSIIVKNEVESISPRGCRRYVEGKFSHARMAREYEVLYRRVLAGETW